MLGGTDTTALPAASTTPATGWRAPSHPGRSRAGDATTRTDGPPLRRPSLLRPSSVAPSQARQCARSAWGRVSAADKAGDRIRGFPHLLVRLGAALLGRLHDAVRE